MDIVNRKCGCIEHYVRGSPNGPDSIFSSRDSNNCIRLHKSIKNLV